MTEEAKTPQIPVKIPALPESITEATILKWHKQPGDSVKAGDHIADIETDKVILEVTAPEDGILQDTYDISKGTLFSGGETIATIIPDNGDNTNSIAAAKDEGNNKIDGDQKDTTVEVSPAQTNQAAGNTSTPSVNNTASKESSNKDATNQVRAMPSASKIAADNNVNLSNIKGSGRDERILKEDVLANLNNAGSSSRIEERVPMSRLRQKIAQRLIQSQQTNAILTTFNEVNMQAIMDLRSKYKDKFEKTHEVKLGFMSFFVKAVVKACKEYPVLNAFIDGTDIVYHGYIDIGIAVSSARGLVVPILRDAQDMSISDIETAIVHYAKKARDGKLELDDLTGGTFSITNGGTFGSMMSTPIINPPQSAILGMHAIKDRAMVEDGQVVIRPMMYLALSYDHRLIDGREAVMALVTIKEALEDPARLLLGV